MCAAYGLSSEDLLPPGSVQPSDASRFPGQVSNTTVRTRALSVRPVCVCPAQVSYLIAAVLGFPVGPVPVLRGSLRHLHQDSQSPKNTGSSSWRKSKLFTFRDE